MLFRSQEYLTQILKKLIKNDIELLDIYKDSIDVESVYKEVYKELI